jgi:hypothetical protein
MKVGNHKASGLILEYCAIEQLLTYTTPAAVTSVAIHLPHLVARSGLSTDNTIGVIFGILTFVLGVLSVAFAWAMWLVTRRGNRRRRQETISMSTPEEDLELQRIARDHHGNFMML